MIYRFVILTNIIKTLSLILFLLHRVFQDRHKKKLRFCLVSEVRRFEWEDTHKKVVCLVLVSLTSDTYTGVRFFCLFSGLVSLTNYGVVKGSKVFSLQVQRNLVFFFRSGILYSLLWLEIQVLCTKKLRRLCNKTFRLQWPA